MSGPTGAPSATRPTPGPPITASTSARTRRETYSRPDCEGLVRSLRTCANTSATCQQTISPSPCAECGLDLQQAAVAAAPPQPPRTRARALPLPHLRPGVRRGQPDDGAPARALRRAALPAPPAASASIKSSNLLEHQTRHTGQRPLRRRLRRGLAQPSRLARHQRIHTGERPFPLRAVWPGLRGLHPEAAPTDPLRREGPPLCRVRPGLPLWPRSWPSTFGCTTARGPTSAPTAARPSPGPNPLLDDTDQAPQLQGAHHPPPTMSEGAGWPSGEGEEDTADLGCGGKKTSRLSCPQKPSANTEKPSAYPF